MRFFVVIVLVAAAGVVVAVLAMRGFWRALGSYKVWRAGPRPLFGVHHRLWCDPGAVGLLDLASGPGGSDGLPQPPFHFLEEHASGSQPCVSVRDGRSRRWRVKWGREVRCETFAVRLAWACGYFAETTHLVREGHIEGVPVLKRASACVDASGVFREARFELDDPSVLKLFDEHSWSWTDNPFLGTPQLAGLKIVSMLLSNWDNKDQRDVARGSNTAIYVHRTSRWKRDAHYLIADWGGSMGRWGGTVVTRGRWDPDGFAEQTLQFVTGTDGDLVRFGYTGQRTGDATTGIRVSDVRWLCTYLGEITDEQLRAALEASGATPEETISFVASTRERIRQLQVIAAD